MDGHWEWSDGDDADTADLGGDDAGHGLHGDDFGADYSGGYDDGHTGFGGDEHDLGEPGRHLSDGHLDGGGDLEEPLGTEHATAEYDESLHDDGDAQAGHGDGDGDGDGDDGQPHLSDGHIDGGDHDDPQSAQPGHDGEDGQLHLSDGHIDGAQEDDTGDGHEAAFGADPDVDASADDPAWHEVHFPEELHLQDPPQPVDGFPWTDAEVLGGPDHSLSAAFDPAGAVHAPAEPAGLADYEHLDVPSGADPWSLLLGSDDPATSSLATFWAPQ